MNPKRTGLNHQALMLLIFFYCALLLPVGFTCSAAGKTRRPNIIFIITDDQRWDSLGAIGHPLAKTPHLDRLAREGASIRNFFTTTPLCSPSRASFLTGQY